MPCLQERKVAPPNIPVKELYVPLRELFEHVKSGKQFKPVTIQQIAAAKKVRFVVIHVVVVNSLLLMDITFLSMFTYIEEYLDC
jgi:hypothetical protein